MELDPCPFCGRQPELLDKLLPWAVQCEDDNHIVTAENVPAWNRRTPPKEEKRG